MQWDVAVFIYQNYKQSTNLFSIANTGLGWGWRWGVSVRGSVPPFSPFWQGRLTLRWETFLSIMYKWFLALPWQKQFDRVTFCHNSSSFFSKIGHFWVTFYPSCISFHMKLSSIGMKMNLQVKHFHRNSFEQRLVFTLRQMGYLRISKLQPFLNNLSFFINLHYIIMTDFLTELVKSRTVDPRWWTKWRRRTS